MPFLRANAAKETANIKASVVMTKEVVTLPTIANMEACKKALQSPHNGFPVINTANRFVGLIPKSMVVKILENKAFYDRDSTDRSQILPEADGI